MSLIIIFFIILPVVLSYVFVAFAFWGEKNYEEAMQMVQSVDLGVLYFFVQVLIYSVFVVPFFYIIYKVYKKHEMYKKLLISGSKKYCVLNDVKEIIINDSNGKVKKKRIFYITPLGKVGMNDVPFDTDIEKGDSVQILFDTANDESFNVAYDGSDLVFKKKERF